MSVIIKPKGGFAKLAKTIDNVISKDIIPKAIKKATPIIKSRIGDLVVQFVQNSPEFKGLSGDFAGDVFTDLQAVLGIENPNDVLPEMLNFIKESVNVVIQPRNISITVLNEAQQQQMVNEPWAKYVSEPSGETISWLEWLMTGQSDPVGVSILYGGIISARGIDSRTGRAIMVSDPTSSFEVSDYIGDRNWISDALNNEEFKSSVFTVIGSSLIDSLKKVSRK